MGVYGDGDAAHVAIARQFELFVGLTRFADVPAVIISRYRHNYSA